jgi:hypothetical protein
VPRGRLQAHATDLLVIYMPKLKFVVLELDAEQTCEFRVYCLFNFENQEELKYTGKRYPKIAMLRSVQFSDVCGFSFIADDTVFTWV